MKYIEELVPGDAFVWNSHTFILTSDFKNNGQKNCIGLVDGFAKWFNSNDIVEHIMLYTTDNDNTIIPIKTTKNESH